MTVRPLVSVIIPCFNAEGSIAEAIQSALTQTYSPVEVVVVDDGSTDGSAAVVRSFGGAVQLVQGPNVGAAAARNRGAATATGDLLQFLDADDRLHPNKLERQVPLAVQGRPGMAFCDADVVDGETNKSRGRWGTGWVPTTDPVVHALRVIVQTAGPLHWRESFDRVGGFRPDTPPSDDRDLHLRLACAGVSFWHLPERLYEMRRYSGSLSKRDPVRGVRSQHAIGEDALADLEKHGRLTETRRAAFAAFFAGTGRVALRAGETVLADACFARAAALHPGGGMADAYSRAGHLVARLLGAPAAERFATLAKVVRGHRDIA